MDQENHTTGFAGLIHVIAQIVALSMRVLLRASVNKQQYENALRSLSRAHNALQNVLVEDDSGNVAPVLNMEAGDVAKARDRLYDAYARIPTTPRHLYREVASATPGLKDVCHEDLSNQEKQNSEKMANRQKVQRMCEGIIQTADQSPENSRFRLAQRQHAYADMRRIMLRAVQEGHLSQWAVDHFDQRSHNWAWPIAYDREWGNTHLAVDTKRLRNELRWICGPPSREEEFEIVARNAIASERARTQSR